MDINTLSKKLLYEGLNGRITGVDYTNDLAIFFQCDNWENHDEIRKFKITCHDVVENDVQPSPSGDIELTSDHQLLWDRNEPYGYLYYSSAPENRHEILGKLWVAHEKIFDGWRQLADYANTYNVGSLIEFCMGHNGELAHGPQPLLEAYQRAVSDRISTNIVISSKKSQEFKALVFDSCFVICQGVTVEECS